LIWRKELIKNPDLEESAHHTVPRTQTESVRLFDEAVYGSREASRPYRRKSKTVAL
jgi:hypothetical protein